ncbi:MAG: HAMP domain-containing sensor histidine kinase [Bacteroidales bacterium]|nr:HAMP domain-containing sensor histidine kinase [Bacteroidales bacterium]
MRRWKFIGLISLMLVSLSGIIGVQLIWINNAVSVRNDLFSRSVFNSLKSTAGKIESSRQMAFYERMMVADSLFQSQINEMQAVPLQRMSPDSGNISLGPGMRGMGESFSFRMTGDGNNVNVLGDYRQYIIDDSTYRNPLRSGVNDLENNPADIDQEHLRLWLRRKSRDLQHMADRMISELYDWEFNSRANRDEVLSVLYDELANSGINTSFEFAVIEGNNIIDGVYEPSSEAQLMSSKYTVNMFNDRLIPRNTRLSVIFPDRKNYILSSMSLLLGGSMLFSLIILLTFALSIFFILRQKRTSQMKSDFINNMTHEFKTPIATISLAADTISNQRVINDENRVKHFISMIKKENARMNKQVENILQLSSLDKSELEFNFSETDMHTIIKRAIDTIEIQVEGRNGNIFYYPGSDEPVVFGDREHLVNLIHNLLDNANKYSVNEPEITITTGNSDGYFVLSVSDKGIGMTKAVQSKIFDRFYRQSSGNVHNVKGFGLGLSYVKAIVDAHKGDIKVLSESGKGTTFEVFLPQDDKLL